MGVGRSKAYNGWDDNWNIQSEVTLVESFRFTYGTIAKQKSLFPTTQPPQANRERGECLRPA